MVEVQVENIRAFIITIDGEEHKWSDETASAVYKSLRRYFDPALATPEVFQESDRMVRATHRRERVRTLSAANRTIPEIADEVGVSQSRVRQILNESL
jgi:DNA-directed RNA polymerase sigma subunit (sigma70/sigma32)